MRRSRNRIVCHLTSWVQRWWVVACCSTVRCHRRVSSRLQRDWFHNTDFLLTLVASRTWVGSVSLWMHYRVRLWIHRCSDGLNSMTCIWARCLIQETILVKTFFLCSYLVLIDGSSFATAGRWAVILRLSYFSYLFVGRMAWDHRVLIVIVSLPGKQVILVHFLLDISHVTVSF